MRICPAATQVSGHSFFDIIEGGRRIVIEECFARHHHPRRAIAALKGITLHKCLLERVELIAFGESFDGGDLCIVCIKREHHTRTNSLAVDLDCATSARSAITDHFGSCEIEFFTEGFGEGGSWLDVDLLCLSVDVERDACAFLGDHALRSGGLGRLCLAGGASEQVGGEHPQARCLEEVAA